MSGVVQAHFREQAMFCDEYGSPFTARLIERMAADLAAGGPAAELVGDWPTNPRADALSLRLAHFPSKQNRPSPTRGEGFTDAARRN